MSAPRKAKKRRFSLIHNFQPDSNLLAFSKEDPVQYIEDEESEIELVQACTQEVKTWIFDHEYDSLDGTTDEEFFKTYTIHSTTETPTDVLFDLPICDEPEGYWTTQAVQNASKQIRRKVQAIEAKCIMNRIQHAMGTLSVPRNWNKLPKEKRKILNIYPIAIDLTEKDTIEKLQNLIKKQEINIKNDKSANAKTLRKLYKELNTFEKAAKGCLLEYLIQSTLGSTMSSLCTFINDYVNIAHNTADEEAKEKDWPTWEQLYECFNDNPSYAWNWEKQHYKDLYKAWYDGIVSHPFEEADNVLLVLKKWIWLHNKFRLHNGMFANYPAFGYCMDDGSLRMQLAPQIYGPNTWFEDCLCAKCDAIRHPPPEAKDLPEEEETLVTQLEGFNLKEDAHQKQNTKEDLTEILDMDV